MVLNRAKNILLLSFCFLAAVGCGQSREAKLLDYHAEIVLYDCEELASEGRFLLEWVEKIKVAKMNHHGIVDVVSVATVSLVGDLVANDRGMSSKKNFDRQLETVEQKRKLIESEVTKRC